MKRLDEGKVSFLEFLRSIKFARQRVTDDYPAESTQHFADFSPRARKEHNTNAEESHLVRSAN